MLAEEDIRELRDALRWALDEFSLDEADDDEGQIKALRGKQMIDTHMRLLDLMLEENQDDRRCLEAIQDILFAYRASLRSK